MGAISLGFPWLLSLDTQDDFCFVVCCLILWGSESDFPLFRICWCRRQRRCCHFLVLQLLQLLQLAAHFA